MASVHDVERARRDGMLFGIPFGDLGWGQSLLIGLATGFAAFFLSTFVAIVSMLCYYTVTHRMLDFSLSYRRVGLPIGLLAGSLALGFLGVQYARRMARKSRGEGARA